MKIIDKLIAIVETYTSTRRCGYTKAMHESVKNNNMLFVFPNMEMASEYFNGVSIQNLDKLRGFKKPVVLDNSVIIEVASEAIRELTNARKEIMHKDAIVAEFISKYENI